MFVVVEKGGDRFSGKKIEQDVEVGVLSAVDDADPPGAALAPGEADGLSDFRAGKHAGFVPRDGELREEILRGISDEEFVLIAAVAMAGVVVAADDPELLSTTYPPTGI